jgi:lysozyme
MRRITLRFEDKKNNAPEHKKQIATLNQRLVWWGVLDAQYAKDTTFSNKTLEAVCSFQEKRGLVIDGIVGHNTWTEIYKSSEKVSDEETVEVLKNEDIWWEEFDRKHLNKCDENGCSLTPQEHEKLDAGVTLIKYWEGLRLSVYVCPAKVNTVGYGATRTLDGKPWILGQKITKQLAEDLLRIQIAEDFLPKLRKLPYWLEMNNNQRSALLSFAYNLGANFYGAKGFETITRNLKNKEWSSIPKTLMLYVNPGSSFEKGLRNRRQAEGQLWSKAV